MAITVEFFGIPRQRTGTPHATVPAGTLGEVLHRLGQEFPDFARDCLAPGEQSQLQKHLQKHFLASVDNNHFVTDPATQLADGQTLLILSADAGG